MPKTAADPNEDSYAHSDRLGTYAVSDGASISYDSASWSRILVRRFARRPDVTSQWLEEATSEYLSLHDRDNLPWMKQAALDRGSFASLLGLRFVALRDAIQIFAVGDTIAALCDGNRILSTFPYSEPLQFDASPQLLSTKPAQNGFFTMPESIGGRINEWSLAGLTSPIVLCATDALGRWLLDNREADPSPIATLCGISTLKEFRSFVHAERTAGRMRRDDTTLLALW